MARDTYWPNMDFIHNRRIQQFSSSGRGLGIVMLIIILLLALASLFYLVQMSRATAASHRIRKLEARKEELQRRKAELLWDIAQQTQPEQLRERAEALGFQTPEEIRPLSYTPARTSQEPPADVNGTVETREVPEPADEPAVGGPSQRFAQWWEKLAAEVAGWTQSSINVFASD